MIRLWVWIKGVVVLFGVRMEDGAIVDLAGRGAEWQQLCSRSLIFCIFSLS